MGDFKSNSIFRQDLTPKELEDFIRDFESSCSPSGMDCAIMGFLLSFYDSYCISIGPRRCLDFFSRLQCFSDCFYDEHKAGDDK